METSSKGTILVVEDNPASRELIGDLLEHAGFSLLFAVDGEEAIQAARDHAPDLILMDLDLPGVDGLTATRRILAEPGMERILIVACTAHAMKKDRELALKAGCVGYLSKPLDTRTVAATIGQFLRLVEPRRRKEPGEERT